MNPKLFSGNTCWGKTVLRGSHFPRVIIQWKPLIMITLGLVLFDNNNRPITLSGGYKTLHYLTQFIGTVQHFTCIKNNNIYLKKLM